MRTQQHGGQDDEHVKCGPETISSAARSTCLGAAVVWSSEGNTSDGRRTYLGVAANRTADGGGVACNHASVH